MTNYVHVEVTAVMPFIHALKTRASYTSIIPGNFRDVYKSVPSFVHMSEHGVTTNVNDIDIDIARL